MTPRRVQDNKRLLFLSSGAPVAQTPNCRQDFRREDANTLIRAPGRQLMRSKYPSTSARSPTCGSRGLSVTQGSYKTFCNRVRGLHMAPHLVPPFLLDRVHFVAIRACCPARHANDAGHDSPGEKDRTSTLAPIMKFSTPGVSGICLKKVALVCCLAFSSVCHVVCQFSSVRSFVRRPQCVAVLHTVVSLRMDSLML